MHRFHGANLLHLRNIQTFLPKFLFSAQTHGEKGDQCADALLLYGRCLLELGRAENCVLGNALKGFSSLEYDSQEELPSTEQFEDPEKVGEAFDLSKFHF